MKKGDWVNAPRECVECCPHCNSENVYENYDVEKNGYVAECNVYHKKIFLCDECFHANDNPSQFCDWNDEKCFRGSTL